MLNLLMRMPIIRLVSPRSRAALVMFPRLFLSASTIISYSTVSSLASRPPLGTVPVALAVCREGGRL